jgi:hypothetical protein
MNVFKIKNNNHFTVNKVLVESYNIPVGQQYDFHLKANLPEKHRSKYKLKPKVKLYKHQETAMSKIFKDN